MFVYLLTPIEIDRPLQYVNWGVMWPKQSCLKKTYFEQIFTKHEFVGELNIFHSI